MQRAKQYFEHHDKSDKLYFTSDNLAFFDRQNAVNHASSLADDTVTEMTREEVYDELSDMTNDEWEYDPLDEPDAE